MQCCALAPALQSSVQPLSPSLGWVRTQAVPLSPNGHCHLHMTVSLYRVVLTQLPFCVVPSGCVPVTSQLPSCPTVQTGPRNSGPAMKLVRNGTGDMAWSSDHILQCEDISGDTCPGPSVQEATCPWWHMGIFLAFLIGCDAGRGLSAWTEAWGWVWGSSSVLHLPCWSPVPALWGRTGHACPSPTPSIGAGSQGRFGAGGARGWPCTTRGSEQTCSLCWRCVSCKSISALAPLKCFEAEELGKEPFSEACQAACLQQNPPAETPKHSRAQGLCWVGAEDSLSLCPFAEDGVAVPGGGRADKLCPAESREERGGEGAAGG